ncbi:MAG: sulfatase-like hydrolase/transferase, partial [Bacteroidales bacterium]|nr:sulfatase-like hydrolase/transferase [Bacteroidales bacterium]
MKKLIILLSVILIIGQSCIEEKNEVKPNIIMFLVDDMGWQDCSEPFWKEKTDFNERYATPNIERLATQGMKFTQAYACAICSPTR